jgi:Protein of unknown function (DUF3365)/HAMP domain
VRLLGKFNLILVVAFGIAAIVISTIAYFFLVDNARHQVLEEAQLMMASATSMRNYTSDDLNPLLEKNPDRLGRFLPETVPAFAATKIFNDLRKTYPDYAYKEATLNPTNLADRATDWESDVIHDLRDHPNLTSLVGERDGATTRQLYLAVPIKATADCMQCHSTPAAAPVTMIRDYGSVNGFGWKVGETIGAQIISVPLSLPLAIAKEAHLRLSLFLALGLVLSIVVLDVGVYLLVIRPLRLASENADRVSRGERDVPDFAVRGKDEIAVVTGAFQRMRLSLAKALKMLDEDD